MLGSLGLSRSAMGDFLSPDAGVAYSQDMDTITLPPELERFAAEAVEAGRYRDVGEVVAAGVGLLRRAESERAAFIRSLEEAEAESDREGWHSLEDVMAGADAIIAAKRAAA